MQVLADVSESDIGMMKVGQPVRFTVDAYPEQSFRGTIAQIRLNATVNQNVVTYPVIIEVPNPDLALRPAMTANVTIDVARRQGRARASRTPRCAGGPRRPGAASARGLGGGARRASAGSGRGPAAAARQFGRDRGRPGAPGRPDRLHARRRRASGDRSRSRSAPGSPTAATPRSRAAS